MNRVLWRTTTLAVALTMVVGVAQASGAPGPTVSPAHSGDISVKPAGLSVYSFDASFSAMAQLTSVTSAGKGMVGVVLPDLVTSFRYATYDIPYLTKAFTAAGYTSSQFKIQNASGTTTEVAIAQADIAAGAKVLLVDPLDGPTGKAIQSLAAAAGIPYISYDRATFQGTTTYYVSFDDVQVGKLIGQGFMDCVTDWKVATPEVFELDGGEDTDPNAISFAAGYNNVIWGTALSNMTTLSIGTTNSAGMTVVGDQIAPGWDNTQGQTVFQTAFTASPNINATVEANDGLANAVITVLKGAGVKPNTIPTTGQDATIQGMENVLEGWQCGSVYKPIYLEAQAAVALATYLRAGQTPPTTLVNGTTKDPNSATTEPAVLLTPYWVNAANMEATVIKDNFVSVTDLCNAVTAAVCTAAGISSSMPATHLAVSGLPSPRSAGAAGSITLKALDADGNTAYGYRGTVHFSSTDPAAVLPADFTFPSADAGTDFFSVTLRTPGTQSVTATDTVTASIKGSQSVVVAPPASTYHATSPARVLDSRPTGSGHTNIGLAGKFTAGTVRTFAVAGVIGVGASSVAVPTNATAVTGNLTIVNETAAGVVALGPTMTPTGAVTTINFVKGDIRANNVTLGLGSGGTLSAVYRSSTAGATIDLIFDVTGYFTPDTTGATYHVLAPGRILDTRPSGSGHTNIGLAGKFANKSVRTFSVAGVKALGWSSALVPATATAVTGNLTVTDATSIGYVSVGPTIAAVPSTSTLNVAAGSTVANGVTVALKSGKLEAVWDGTAGSSADVIFDVTGYFTAGSGGLSFYPIAPVRLLDSSVNLGLTGTFASRTARLFTIGGTAGVPSGAAGIAGNLTVLSPTSAGWALVSPEIVATPITSTLNVASGHSEANGFDVALGASGHVALEWAGTTGSTANLALDISGYWK